MGASASLASNFSDLLGFLETGGGARLVTYAGPTAPTRLALTCQDLASARAPWVSWEALKYGCAELAAQAELESTCDRKGEDESSGPFNAEELIAALSGQPDLLPERELLRALCRICGPYGQGSSAAEVAIGLDELCIALTNGRNPKPLLLWSRALRKPGLSALLERIDAQAGSCTTDSQPSPCTTDAQASPCTIERPSPCSVEERPSPCSIEDLFEAILSGKSKFSLVLQLLATGVDLNTPGPKMLNGDPGCCHWNVLAAAAHNSSRAGNAIYVVALLLAARVNADACCIGPCRWSPLMHAAQANSPQVCKMLVMTQADPRKKHAGNGNTALDMANKETARAIKEAQEQRNVKLSLQGDHSSIDDVQQQAQASRKGRGRGRGYSPNLAALTFAGRGKRQSRGQR